jgi:hypothetical protein
MTHLHSWLVAGLRRLVSHVLPVYYVRYTYAPVAGWVGVLLCEPIGVIAFVGDDGALFFDW